jgi:hypothetical protein
MMIMKDKQVKEWIKEEQKSARMYDKHGFGQIANDERRHAVILNNTLQQKRARRFLV